jgi:hypothetical protein
MAQKQPLVLSGAQIEQLQASDYANIGIPFFMHKNRILNGDFNVWQRGPGLQTLTTNGYWPDQWNWSANGTGANISFQQKAFAAGQTAVPDNPLYYCELSISIGASGQTVNVVQQNIESVQTFQGQTVTLSFWAKADATRTVSANFVQNFGTGGSPSSNVGITGSTFSLTTSWAKYTTTVALPSISGKTLGTSGNDCLLVQFWLPNGSGFTIDIAHVQLEQGSNATQFEYRHVAHELQMCQRYFESITSPGGFSTFGVAVALGSTSIRFPLLFKQKKRVVPSASSSGPSTFNYDDNAANHAGGSVDSSWWAGTITGSTIPVPGCGLLNDPNTAAYFWFSAEL